MDVPKDSIALDGDEIRRKRNRDSQRHFREPRNRYVKELEERIATFSKSDSERNAKLLAENNYLRNSLSRARVHSLTLKSVLSELLKSMNEEPCPGITSSLNCRLQRHILV
ncbi:uncharacterized protein A1O9_11828 [Exophiala aquamarina CBS 119918]|uniref:BZIP domain-containing protein n=1 Tax=Exophiala aquamarina CBS 119918 TaxID=1182545 RepID=A0A072NX91_9EURO|nr:uncharacterized protein A1O9_11828 [Exophiala aquamarina CBS 119918]KEF52201.1 hypothetical protein A1O9_11828 [Exophiala aquamarina CBS 119918]